MKREGTEFDSQRRHIALVAVIFFIAPERKIENRTRNLTNQKTTMSYYEIRSAILGERVDDLKTALGLEPYTDYITVIGQTPLLEFLHRKVKLNVNDLRIVLLLLGAGTDVDKEDNFGNTARKRLLYLGYSVDRKYLSITLDQIRRIAKISSPPEEDDLYA